MRKSKLKNKIKTISLVASFILGIVLVSSIKVENDYPNYRVINEPISSRNSPPVLANCITEVEYEYASTGNFFEFEVVDGKNKGSYDFEVDIPTIGWYSISSGTWKRGEITSVEINLDQEIPSVGLLCGDYDARLSVRDKKGELSTIDVLMHVVSMTPPEIINYLPSVIYEYNTSGNVYTFEVADDDVPGPRTYSVGVSFFFVGWIEIYSGTWEPGVTNTIDVDLTEELPFLGLPLGTYKVRLKVVDPTGLSDSVEITASIVKNIAPKITNYLPSVVYEYNTSGNEYTFQVDDDNLPGLRTYSVEVKFPFIGYCEIYSGTWEPGVMNTVLVDLTEKIPFLGLPKGIYNARLKVVDPSGLSDMVEIQVEIKKT